MTTTANIVSIIVTEPAIDWSSMGARMSAAEGEALQSAYEARALDAVAAAYPDALVSRSTACVVRTEVAVETGDPSECADFDGVRDHVRELLGGAWMATCEAVEGK